MKAKILTAAILLVTSTASAQTTQLQNKNFKPRVIVTTDPELDDNNSLIRYLLFSSDFQTEGLIYASSKFHWKGDGHGTRQFIKDSEYDKAGLGPQTSWRWDPAERFIDADVDAYELCYPNLVRHDPDYPTPAELRSKIRWGNVEFEGDYTTDSPGSDLIKRVILDDKPGRVFLQTWGGASTVAAALRAIEDEYKGTAQWNVIQKKVNEKCVLCMSGDQDGSYPKYIAKAWPDIPKMGTSNFAPLVYNGQNMVQKEYAFYLQPKWVSENLRIGPFGSRQRVWGDGVQYVKGDIYDYFGFPNYTKEQLTKMGYRVWSALQPAGSFLAEGDTFCYLNLIDNGLRAFQDNTWGGWSGRYREIKPIKTTNGFQRFAPDEAIPKDHFFPEIMDGLAARFHWSVSPNYKDCNHYPVVDGPLVLTAKPGQTVNINATASDPDGDKLSIKWWQFKVGTYNGDCNVADPTALTTTFTVPADAKKGQTIHLILEVNDGGTPNLKRYLRTVVTVK